MTTTRLADYVLSRLNAGGTTLDLGDVQITETTDRGIPEIFVRVRQTGLSLYLPPPTVDDEAPPPPPVWTAAELQALTVADLKEIAAGVGLPVSGTKAALIDRILEEAS